MEILLGMLLSFVVALLFIQIVFFEMNYRKVKQRHDMLWYLSLNRKFNYNRTGYIAFMRLEGDEINIPGAAETKISVKREGDVVKLLRIYKPDDIMVSDELTAPSSLIPDEKLRDIRTFYQNVIEICSIFRDGSSYRGKVKVNIVDSADGKTFTPKLTLTHGTYTFSNGDVFTGNLSGQYYGGIPIDGTMKFADGTEASGNWLKKI